MAPIKFEEHIKDQLEERRIEPSAAGWERISGQLEMQQGKKKNKRVLWMSIAASFIIGVGITAVLLQNEKTEVGPVVVTPENESAKEILEKTNQEERIPLLNDKLIEQEVAEVVTPNRSMPEDKIAKNLIKRPVKVVKQQSALSNKLTEAVAVSTEKIKQNNLQDAQSREDRFNTTIIINDSNSQQDVEVVAAVENKELVTDQEIDALLRNAHGEIISDQLINPENNKIDANALLLDVEAQVDPERFKDKIFKTLKSEFSKAVEAVANKDN